MRRLGTGWRIVAVGLVALVAACGSSSSDSKTETSKAAPQSTQASASTEKAAWQVEWEKTVEAAKKEKLVVVTHPGDDYIEFINAFKKAYPGITVEHTGLRPSEFTPKLLTEQKNGLYSWDVWTTATSNMNNVVMPAGGFQEITPFLMLPEVTDPKNYRGGKLLYTSDKGNYILLQQLNVSNGLWVNRQLVPTSQFKSSEDLQKPEFKGKILIRDLSAEHAGSLTMAGYLNAKGEDWVRRLLVDQQPQFSENATLVANSLIQGKVGIAIGGAGEVLDECRKEGGCKQIEEVQDIRYALGRGVAVFKNAPHPNATKVFVNWLMSKEGQQKFVEIFSKYNTTGGHSIRADVEPLQKDSAPDYSNLQQYSLQGTDFGKPQMDKILQMYKEIRK